MEGESRLWELRLYVRLLFPLFQEFRDVAREMNHRTENEFVLKLEYKRAEKRNLGLKEQTTKWIPSQTACNKGFRAGQNALNLRVSKLEETFQWNFSKVGPEMIRSLP